MIKIIIANISITSNSNNINPKIKENCILTFTDTYFSIGNDYSLKLILSIKSPNFISSDKDVIIIKDDKKDIIYNIDIHTIYNSIESTIKSNKVGTSNLINSEKDMKIDIINNFNEYFPNSRIIKAEYNTPYGNIDILAINNKGEYEIIELKKRSTDLNTINQVSKYGEYFDENNKIYNLYVIGISNNGRNIKYALDKNVKIIHYNLK